MHVCNRDNFNCIYFTHRSHPCGENNPIQKHEPRTLQHNTCYTEWRWILLVARFDGEFETNFDFKAQILRLINWARLHRSANALRYCQYTDVYVDDRTRQQYGHCIGLVSTHNNVRIAIVVKVHRTGQRWTKWTERHIWRQIPRIDALRMHCLKTVGRTTEDIDSACTLVWCSNRKIWQCNSLQVNVSKLKPC